MVAPGASSDLVLGLKSIPSSLSLISMDPCLCCKHMLWGVASVDRSAIYTEASVGWPTEDDSEHSTKSDNPF